MRQSLTKRVIEMLTPNAKDPNRKAELQRKERHPETFCSQHKIDLPNGWRPTGLVDLEGRHLGTDPRVKRG